MSKHRAPKKNLHEILEDMEKRIEKAENEICRLRGIIQTKNRKVIHEWLNQTSQIPSTHFDGWRKEIQAHSRDVEKMMNGSVSGGLVEGVISCLDNYIEKTKTDRSLPIRCFSQKPKTFYIYSIDEGWKMMKNDTEMIGALMESIEKKVRRKYNSDRKMEGKEDEEVDLDKSQMILDKINGTKMAKDKRVGVFKKWLFSKLEENLTVLMDCEFV